MLGAIIGDIVGSCYEFNRTNDYNFELFPKGASFTDDTICTIAVADALLRDRDFGETIHEWCRRYPNPKGGYGGRFKRWVMSDNPEPYGSFGNGSAMRVSPVGWWANDPTECISLARKSAECTHSHEDGIDGAISIAAAIMDCRNWREDRNNPNYPERVKKITPQSILDYGINHALMIQGYGLYVSEFNLDLNKYRNRFDETCQGTVPVALYIVMTSNSFEDAIRRAVSLGADADTLGAIVGSIAEVIWGIPEWMKKKAMTYLPEEMRNVLNEFRTRLSKLKKLTKRCEYYKYNEFVCEPEAHAIAFKTEYKWAHDVARSYDAASNIKLQMAKLASLAMWQEIADRYYLPLSLVGYLFKASTPNFKLTKVNQKRFHLFLEENYAKRKPLAEKIKTQREHIATMKATMLWKLGLGNMARLFNNEDPMPSKQHRATAESWQLEPMPATDISTLPTKIIISSDDMKKLRQGHIPDAMEDHWMMYCTDTHICYHRSWTGIAIFEARYTKYGSDYVITELTLNHALMEWGVTNDTEAFALFDYLINAETGHHPGQAWRKFINIWEDNQLKSLYEVV